MKWKFRKAGKTILAFGEELSENATEVLMDEINENYNVKSFEIVFVDDVSMEEADKVFTQDFDPEINKQLIINLTDR